MVGHGRQPFRKLIAARFLHLVAAPTGSLCVCAAFVRLVNDYEVPTLLPDPLTNIVLLRVVQRCDNLRLSLPRVYELLLIVARMDDLETFTEETQELVLPLDGQRCGHED